MFGCILKLLLLFLLLHLLYTIYSTRMISFMLDKRPLEGNNIKNKNKEQ